MNMNGTKSLVDSKANIVRSSCPEVFCKEIVLRNFTKFTGKHLCHSLFLISCWPQACNFIKKENLAWVCSCEFCEMSRNTFLHRTPLVAASVLFLDITLIKLDLLPIFLIDHLYLIWVFHK